MSTENDDQDGGEWDERSDLTRLEDLSEFLHEEDPDVEARLKEAEDSESELPDLPPPPEEDPDLVGLGELEDDSLTDSAEPPSFSEDKTDPAFNPSDLTSDDSEEPDTQWDQNEDNEDEDGNEDSNEANFGENSDNFENLSTSDSSGSFDLESDGDNFNSDSDEEFTLAEDDSHESSGDSFDNENTSDQFDNDNFETDDGEDEDLGSNVNEDEDSFQLSEEDPSDTSTQNDYEDEDEDQDQDEGEFVNQNQYEDTNNFNSDQDQNFDLPDPEELESRPPIEAATSQDSTGTTQTRENFQDLRDFGNAITYGVVTTGGNPPYSLILRNVKYEEDAEDIQIVLREHGLMSDENEDTITQGLEQGSLLISQISEYSAIFLAHKLRRFDVELRIGLSDQLHPSKSYSREGKGLVSKYNLRQNHREALVMSEAEVDVHDIKMSTTPTLDGYNIHRYVDVITTHTLIEEAELKRLHNLNQSVTEDQDTEVLLEEILEQFPTDDLESPMEQFDLGLNEIYRELVVELRNEAFKVEANAVVGINFNITPMMFRSGNSTSVHYKITCSGNAVWVTDHQ